MTVETDPAVQAMTDARALLDTLLASGWQEMHVVSGDTQIFLARPGGGFNPMRVAPPVEAAPASSSIAQPVERQVKAPHVVTLVDAVAIGTPVVAGERIATVRVLDEEQEIEAPVAGTVILVNAVIGELVDHDGPLLTIAEAA